MEENSYLLNTSIEKGLLEKEAEKRLEKFGKNVLVEKKPFALVIDFFSTFFSPLILLLIGASFISAVLGDLNDFLIILGIILVSGFVTFFQHFRAEHTAEKLKQKVTLSTTVIRDGQKKEIPFSHVTIGDIIVLGVGDIIPADSNVLSAKDLMVDESMLTGESFPIEKSTEHKNLFLGTHIVSGETTAVVTAIGKNSRFGKLSREILVTKPQTSFDKGVNSFAILVLKVVLVMTVIVFGANAFLHHNILEAFLFAVAVAVGITPELLPVILTINLARGALKMEHHEVIVKYLPSIQNLGGMTVLCTDKTGTLTENAVSLESYQDIDGEKNQNTLLYGVLVSNFQSGFHNPLDLATIAHKHMISLSDYKKIDDIPFDFSRKMASVIVEDLKTKKKFMATKGSLHTLLPKITHYLKGNRAFLLDKKAKSHLEKLFVTMSENGSRVIGVAFKNVEKDHGFEPSDENNLTFVGFLTFADPVKESAKKTLKEMEDLGVVVKILTGDNEFVSKSVCSKVGISSQFLVLGPDMEKMSDEELSKKIKTTSIFARLNPEQKAKIIELLKKQGEVVGYLGDGINDAPPLKTSDVGISVHNGSDIAREVADVVLMRKSLEVLKEGIVEGRKTHMNILKYIQMEISSNFGNMVTIAIASFFLPFLPLLPVQILLNNFLYDLSQMAIPSDNVDSNLIIKPKKWDISFIKRFMFLFGSVSSIFDFLTFFVLLGILHVTVAAFRTGWFVESLLTQTLVIFLIRTRMFPFFKSKPGKLLIISAAIVSVVGIMLTVFPVGRYFSFVPLSSRFYIFIFGITVLYLFCVELAKKFFYSRINQ